MGPLKFRIQFSPTGTTIRAGLTQMLAQNDMHL